MRLAGNLMTAVPAVVVRLPTDPADPADPVVLADPMAQVDPRQADLVALRGETDLDGFARWVHRPSR